MVVSFLRLEELPVVKSVSVSIPPIPLTLIPFQSPLRLPTASRPSQVAGWMRYRSYAPEHTPFISNLSSYRDSWVRWWTSCQPAWRKGKGWPLPRDHDDATNWVKIGACGQSGLFIVIVSTAWWAYSIKSEEEWVKFDEAVDDVKWVIEQVTGSLTELGASRPPTRVVAPKKSQKPNSSATWMTRETGKRQPKPSRKLLEAGGV